MSPRPLMPLVTLLLLLAGCEREERRFQELSPAASPTDGVQQSQLQPGEPATLHPPKPPPQAGAYQENAYAISQGKQLYAWFGCVGCHANGGGGMGPPLIDDEWRYGAEPQNIYDTIVEGRPNGMPAFRQKLTPQQVWQLTAYVRSISGLVPLDAANGRRDHMWVRPPENMKVEEKPTPEQAEHPE
jgi:cytochrome c oxidase cbb3-type subunit III